MACTLEDFNWKGKEDLPLLPEHGQVGLRLSKIIMVQKAAGKLPPHQSLRFDFLEEGTGRSDVHMDSSGLAAFPSRSHL